MGHPGTSSPTFTVSLCLLILLKGAPAGERVSECGYTIMIFFFLFCLGKNGMKNTVTEEIGIIQWSLC